MRPTRRALLLLSPRSTDTDARSTASALCGLRSSPIYREPPNRSQPPATRHHRHRTARRYPSARPGMVGSAAHRDDATRAGSTLGPTGVFQQAVPRMERPERGGAGDPGGGRGGSQPSDRNCTADISAQDSLGSALFSFLWCPTGHRPPHRANGSFWNLRGGGWWCSAAREGGGSRLVLVGGGRGGGVPVRVRCLRGRR